MCKEFVIVSVFDTGNTVTTKI